MNNKSSCVNTHKWKGSVYNRQQISLKTETQRQVVGHINRHCTTSWCSLCHCSWNISRRPHRHSYSSVRVIEGEKPPCKVSHISTHHHHHHHHPTTPNATALSPLPAHSGFHLSFHTAWPTLKHCGPGSRALKPVKFSARWCSAVCVFVYLLDSSRHWTCCVKPRPRLPSGHLARDCIVSSFSALAILYFFPSSQQQTSCFGEVSALCPSSSPLRAVCQHKPQCSVYLLASESAWLQYILWQH